MSDSQNRIVLDLRSRIFIGSILFCNFLFSSLKGKPYLGTICCLSKQRLLKRLCHPYTFTSLLLHRLIRVSLVSNLIFFSVSLFFTICFSVNPWSLALCFVGVFIELQNYYWFSGSFSLFKLEMSRLSIEIADKEDYSNF